MAQEAGKVWIILDALDECPRGKEQQREKPLSWIEHLRSSQMHIHLLVTSRPEQDIIPIQSDLIGEDISAYNRARVRYHEGLRKWGSKPKVQSEIEARLIEKANAM